MKITIPDLIAQALRASQTVQEVRSRMLAPNIQKKAPTFNTSQLALLCETDKNQLRYQMTKTDLPPGKVNESGRGREFSLSEALKCVRVYRAKKLRPEGKKAMTITVGNFKGGVSKTTTAMSLAQGLSLRGHRVLMIDTDPQGSLTTLFGFLPDIDVEEETTLIPLTLGEQSSVEYAIRKTYWEGIDLVAACPALFNIEFILPAHQLRKTSFKFWDVLNAGLEAVRDIYDVIIIDTAPALSYGTVNSLMAADGLVIPVPPNALDFLSSVQFWLLFSDLASNINIEKTFSFINVLLSRVDLTDPAASVVREWITAAYAEKVLPMEIPKTTVVSGGSAEFLTVYDITKYPGSAKTYRRAREAYDRFTEIIEQRITTFWENN